MRGLEHAQVVRLMGLKTKAKEGALHGLGEWE